MDWVKSYVMFMCRFVIRINRSGLKMNGIEWGVGLLNVRFRMNLIMESVVLSSVILRMFFGVRFWIVI